MSGRRPQVAAVRVAAVNASHAFSIAGGTGGVAVSLWKDFRRSGRPTSCQDHRHRSAGAGFDDFVHVVTDASPCLGAHDFVVVLLALLTRCKLLQQIPRRSGANTARYCSFFPRNALRSMKQPFKDRPRRRRKRHHDDLCRKKSVRRFGRTPAPAIRPEVAFSQIDARPFQMMLGCREGRICPAADGEGRCHGDLDGAAERILLDEEGDGLDIAAPSVQKEPGRPAPRSETP